MFGIPFFRFQGLNHEKSRSLWYFQLPALLLQQLELRQQRGSHYRLAYPGLGARNRRRFSQPELLGKHWLIRGGTAFP
mgnify:FL=1